MYTNNSPRRSTTWEGQEWLVVDDHLVVVLVECHLHIETDKLAEVTVSERVLRSEDGSDLKDSLKVRADTHLLVQLRALSQEGESFQFVSERRGWRENVMR